MKMFKKIRVILLSVMVCLSTVSTSVFAANQQMVVDLSASTGALRYGATGFLYGLGNDGTPTDNMIAALKPRVAAQKAPNGLQHPNGDALEVSSQFKRDGGQQVFIYMQDIYQDWPYTGGVVNITDYLSKVDTMVRQTIADPNRSMYVYVPLNEPDLQWYGTTGTKEQNMFNDWKSIYQKIRSIDPTGLIAGPNISGYNATFMNDFMTFCKTNSCVPDVMTWHELQNSFFTDWYNNYNNYRSIESTLGLSQRQICIDEYGRISGDIPVPGNLVQYVARFENSKVDGCLAYWTSAGCLNDLVTWNNKATGGWWLYKWYGDMKGNTVSVTPPTQNGSLQGLASLDSTNKQAQVIFGGSANATDVFSTDVVVKGFGSAAYMGSKVHAIVWGVDNSGTDPSNGPYFVQEGDYTVANGQITVPVSNMKALSAYHMTITPSKTWTSANITNRYEAEYARLSGSANVSYSSNTGFSGTYFVEGYGASNNASTEFTVTAPSDGYYNVTLRYSAGPLGSAPTNRSVSMVLNGSQISTVACPGTSDWNTWSSVTTKVFLQAGINRIAYNAYTTDDSDALNIDYIDVASTTGTITSYEAEVAGNTLAGTAVISSDTAASGGKYVGYIGAGAANTLKFNNVNVATAGTYRMVVQYANGELGAGASNYNSNIVDRYANISINGGTAQKSYFRNTLGWSNYRTTVISVNLNAGNNTILFSNSSTGYAPNIDKIQIAAPVGN